MYGFMFTAHTPLFSVYLAKPKILTYQRFDSKDLYIFVIAISQLSTNSMQPSMQGLWISSKTNTDNQSVKIKRFVPKRQPFLLLLYYRYLFPYITPYCYFCHLKVKLRNQLSTKPGRTAKIGINRRIHQSGTIH